jgi:hypothetical protein
MVTADSWDYLGAARSIGEQLDFASTGECGLRDCRVPGYSAFLALFLPFTQLQSDRILVLQAMLGMAGVVTGWWIGRILRSKFAAEALAIFLGLNPIYLFNEHWLMSEGLSLVAVLVFVAVWMTSLRDGLTLGRGILLGLVIGASTLIRINSFPFCATLAAGLLVAEVRRGSFSISTGRFRSSVAVIFAMGVASVAVVGPWVVRNQVLYGQITLNAHTNRTLLIYRACHDAVDRRMPLLKQTSAVLGNNIISYEWLATLKERYGLAAAEQVAGQILKEQARSRRRRALAQFGLSIAGFAGYYRFVDNDVAMTRFWFDHFVGRNDALNKMENAWSSVAAAVGFRYARRDGDPRWTRYWQRLGLTYLVKLRPLLFVGFLFARAVHLRSRRAWSIGGADEALLWLSAGYVATFLFHAFTLTDSDRFGSLYDWVPLLLVAWVAQRVLRSRAAPLTAVERYRPLVLGRSRKAKPMATGHASRAAE